MNNNIIYFKSLLVFLLVFIAGFSVSYFGGQDNLMRGVEESAIELNTIFRGSAIPKTSIVIVDIDKQSLEKEGIWPWSTTKMTSLLEKIANQHPTAIGLNMLFDGSDRNGEENFVKVISSGKLVVAVALKYPNTIRFWNKIIKKYNTQINMGYVDNVIELKHGVIGNDATLNEGGEGYEMVAFSKKASKYITDNNYPALKKGSFKVAFYGPENTFRHVSAYKILNDGNNTVSLNNKFVLVGADVGVGQVLTPFGEMSLTEVEANIIQSISDNNLIKDNKLVNFFIYLICGGLIVFSIITKRFSLFFISICLFFSLWHILFVLFNFAIPVIGMLITQIFNIVIGLSFSFLVSRFNSQVS